MKTSETKQQESKSPWQLAWKRFRKNRLAMAGMIFLIFCTVLAIFAYPLMPDSTRNANFQILELSKQPPGTQAMLLLVPRTTAEVRPGFIKRFFGGDWDRYEPIVLQPDTPKDAATVITLAEEEMVVCPECKLKKVRFTLGTDSYGRDVLSRLMLGARVSLAVGLLAVLLSLVLGIGLGALAGFFGGKVDAVVMWFVSVIWSVPTLLLAIAISFALGKGFWQVFVAIGLSMWVEVARIVRGQIFSIREKEYVEATRALGYKPPRVILRHVIPNVVSPVIIIAAANFAAAILIEAGLSFLGIGVQPPVPSWGAMIYEGYTYIVFESGKWLAIFPGMAIVFVVISLNLVGFGLRDALDPKYDFKAA